MSASSIRSDNVPSIDLNNFDEDVDGDSDSDSDSPCFPDTHFALSPAPVMETGFEDDEEVRGYRVTAIPRVYSVGKVLLVPFSPSLATIEEECSDNDPKSTILGGNNSNEQTVAEIKKRGIFNFTWADDEEDEEDEEEEDEEEEDDDYDHIYSYDGPPNAYSRPADFDNRVDSNHSATLDSDALDDITHLIKEDEAHDIDIAEVRRPTAIARFQAALSEVDAVINLANALITDLTTINEAVAILRQDRFAEVECKLRPDSLYGQSNNCCAWALYPIAFRPDCLTGPYNSCPTPFLCVTDPEGQTYLLEERLWEMSQTQLDSFIERDERHRNMQPFVLENRDVDETYEQYDRALTARKYWADCMEQDEMGRFWAAEERAAKRESEEEREAQEEANNSRDENVNEKPSNEANTCQSSKHIVDDNNQFGSEPPTPQLPFCVVSKTSSVPGRFEVAKEGQTAEQRAAEQALFDAKFEWIWSIRHVVSRLIDTNRDSLTTNRVRFFDPLRRYIRCLKPPVYINLKILSNWLRDGRPIQGRTHGDLFDDFYEMIIEHGPVARAVNTYLDQWSHLASNNPQRDAQIEEEELRVLEQETADEGTGNDGKLIVWDMGRECICVVR